MEGNYNWKARGKLQSSNFKCERLKNEHNEYFVSFDFSCSFLVKCFGPVVQQNLGQQPEQLLGRETLAAFYDQNFLHEFRKVNLLPAVGAHLKLGWLER